jgi:hypothetical protein
MFEPVADLPYLFATGEPEPRVDHEFVRQTIEINGCKLMPYAQPYFTRWHAAPPRARWLEPEYRD